MLSKNKKIREAAYSYMLIKLILIILTVIFVPCILCKNKTKYIIRGLIHVFLFGHFIGIGLILATKILTLITLLKALLYSLNFFISQEIVYHLPLLNMPLELMSEHTGNRWFFLVAAFLSSLCVYMLIRAWRIRE